MELPDYGLLSKWLILYGENIAVAMIIVGLYASIRPSIRDDRPRLASAAIGAMFGLCAIVSMSLPIFLAQGIKVDMRNVFVLTAGLSGGPLGAGVAAAIAIVFRCYLAGPGLIIGVGGILIAAAIGALVARRFGPRVREFGVGQLVLVGLVAALANHVWGRSLFLMMDLTPLPLEAVIATILLYPAGTVVLATAVNMTHYRVLQKTQRQLLSVFETTSDLVYETNAAGRFTLLAGKVHAILGYEPAEIVGQTSAVFRGHWQDDATRDIYLSAVKSRQQFDELKYVVSAKDGSERIVSISGRPSLDAAGRFTGFRGVAADITGRRRAETALEAREQQLRLSEERLALAQRVGNVGSVDVDIATDTAIWSEELYHLLGLRPEGGSSFEYFSSAFHPDDRPALNEDRLALARGDSLPPREYRIVMPNGELRWLLRQVKAIRDDSGKPVRHLSTYLDITESKKAALALQEREAELQLNREHLALAQHVAALGSVELDYTTGALHWSDEVFRILGLDPATTKPDIDRFRALLHPDDRATFDRVRLDAREGRESEAGELRIIRPDGQMRWIFRRVVLFKEPNGTVVKSIATLHDVTARHQMEEELRHSREHLALAQQVATIGSLEYSFATGALYWSDEIYRITGLDPKLAEPADTNRFYQLVHPDDRSIFEQAREEVRNGREPQPFELRIVRPDGQVRWISGHVRLIRDDGGSVVGVLGTLQDVTQRRQMEEELRQSREHLALAQQVGLIGSGEINLKTGVTKWTDEWFAILGLDPTQVVPGRDAYMAVVHPEDRAIAEGRAARNWQAQPNEPVEYRIVRPDGEVRWVHVRTTPLPDHVGGEHRVVATLQDITDRKRAQSERAELERQLLQAQKMEAIGNLTGGIAHDFNNLLSVILGRLDMAAEELGDRPKVREWIETCIKAANRGATLTRSMLAFSRQQPLQPVDLDVGAAIGDVMAILPRTLGETIEINVSRAADLWPCHADPVQLQNAVLNLALNARDAMPNGGKLTIETSNARLDADYAARNADVTAGDYVALSVSDTGIGMTPEVAARAFDPFFTTKDVGKGSGLGLSMVYGFVRQSGGHVKIYSEVGRGTTVCLYLPRGYGRANAGDDSARAPILRTGHETILVVEDDADVRDLTVAMLRRLGYTVLAAADAAEALPLLKSSPEVALLVSDVTLPGGTDGRALAEKVAEIAPHVKVVFMSGYAQSAVFRHGHLDAGVTLLQKPFTVEELSAALGGALDVN